MKKNALLRTTVRVAWNSPLGWLVGWLVCLFWVPEEEHVNDLWSRSMVGLTHTFSQTASLRIVVLSGWNEAASCFSCTTATHLVKALLLRKSLKTASFLPLPASGSFLAKGSFHSDLCLSCLLWLPLTSLSYQETWNDIWLPWISPYFRIIKLNYIYSSLFPMWGGIFVGLWN